MAAMKRTPCANERTVKVLVSMPAETSQPGRSARRAANASDDSRGILSLLPHGAAKVRQELGASFWILLEDTQHGAGLHTGLGFLHAANGGTHVQRLDDDGDTLGLDDLRQKVGNLAGEA